MSLIPPEKVDPKYHEEQERPDYQEEEEDEYHTNKGMVICPKRTLYRS
jgi:hypothetical protein